MGNQKSTNKDQEFEKFNQDILKKWKKDKSPRDNLIEMFQGHTKLSQKIIEFTKIKYKDLTQDNILKILQIFYLESEKLQDKDLVDLNYSLLQFLVLINFQNQYLGMINHSQQMNFIDFLSSILIGDNNQKLRNIMIPKFTIGESRPTHMLIKDLKHTMPLLVLYLKNIFQQIFQGKKIENFSQGLLSDVNYVLLSCCTKEIWNITPQLVYSSHQSGSSFNRLAHALKGYNAPVILLIKNKYSTMEQEDNRDIFGAFSNSTWQDELSYFGSPQTFLFSLYPKFNSFYTHQGKGGKSYIYLNTKKIPNSRYKQGMGFGGEKNEDYRIWLDYDLINSSTAYDYGTTYKEGILTNSPDKFLKIVNVEIWGFPSKDTQDAQQKFRNQEEQMIKNSRKIDKKMMFGVGTEMILQKQYKFKEQLNIDLDFEKRNIKDQDNQRDFIKSSISDELLGSS